MIDAWIIEELKKEEQDDINSQQPLTLEIPEENPLKDDKDIFEEDKIIIEL